MKDALSHGKVLLPSLECEVSLSLSKFVPLLRRKSSPPSPPRIY